MNSSKRTRSGKRRVTPVLEKNVLKTKRPKFHKSTSRIRNIYDITDICRGFCLIFANSNFPTLSNLPPLPGYGLDAERLERVFEQLHFRVITFRNIYASAILENLKLYSSQAKEHQAFVCIILTHGNRGVLLGTDFENPILTPAAQITIEQIIEIFDNRNCEVLQGKPKMFFIQACRGEKEDEGVVSSAMVGEYYSQDSQNSETALSCAVPLKVEGLPDLIAAKDEANATQHRLATRTDIMVCYSTIPGFKSFVANDGSIFGKALAKTLILFAHNTDLQHLMNKLSASVARKETKLYNEERGAIMVLQSVSISLVGWRYKLFFNPGSFKLITPTNIFFTSTEQMDETSATSENSLDYAINSNIAPVNVSTSQPKIFTIEDQSIIHSEEATLGEQPKRQLRQVDINMSQTPFSNRKHNVTSREMNITVKTSPFF